MSKRKDDSTTQRSVADIFAPKRKHGANDEPEDGGDNESDSIGSNNPRPSNPNHNVHIDLKMERVECANWNDIFFDFVFHLSGTSFQQINIDRGEGELASDSTSNLRVRIEGTAQENVQLHVRVGNNRKHKRKKPNRNQQPNDFCVDFCSQYSSVSRQIRQ